VLGVVLGVGHNAARAVTLDIFIAVLAARQIERTARDLPLTAAIGALNNQVTLELRDGP
jgi:hypothetical protein